MEKREVIATHVPSAHAMQVQTIDGTIPVEKFMNAKLDTGRKQYRDTEAAEKSDDSGYNTSDYSEEEDDAPMEETPSTAIPPLQDDTPPHLRTRPRTISLNRPTSLPPSARPTTLNMQNLGSPSRPVSTAAFPNSPAQRPGSLYSRRGSTATIRSSILGLQPNRRSSFAPSLRASLQPSSSQNAHLSTISTTNPLFDLLLSDSEIVASPNLSIAEKKAKLTASYIRAAGNGDIAKVREMMGSYKEWIDMDGRDEDGTTALIYAACFGHAHVAHVLLENGAKVDEKDKHGWTALMWACSNNYDEMAKLLIQFGADKATKSNNGRSVKDLVGRQSTSKREIRKILEMDLSRLAEGSVGSDEDDEDGEQDFGERRRRWSSVTAGSDVSRPHSRLSVDELGLEEEHETLPFEWDRCPWDQMLVFDEGSIDHILEVAIVRIRPARGTHALPVPANILFLCARFAHYYNGPELLETFFEKAVDKICEIIRAGRDDTHLLAWWLANSHQLLHFLKRDQNLCISSFQTQFTLSELIHELYQLILGELEGRLISVIEPALMQYVDKTSKGKNPRLENAFTGFARRKSLLNKKSINSLPKRKTKEIKPPSVVKPMAGYEYSPQTVCAILTGTLRVLKSCSVHPSIINQLFNQTTYFINAEIFNRIMTNKLYCCRSKAAQMRINVAFVEEWLRQHHEELVADAVGMVGSSASSTHSGSSGFRSPSSPPPMHTSVPRRASFTLHTPTPTVSHSTPLVHLRPTIHLLHLIQTISTTPDLFSFIELMTALDALTMPQVRTAMENYKYEIGEKSFKEEVEVYVQGVCDDLAMREMERIAAEEEELRQRIAMMQMEDGTEGGDVGYGMDENAERRFLDQDEEGADIFADLLDGGYLLPFMIPQGGREGGSGFGKEVPVVPDEVMVMLDEKMGLGNVMDKEE
ncbi:hypothetical protein HK097_009396 [Rhizophlyctis rosea]|uniref:Dilute domain-containing protein n=1 Tax=Rhizophlyctis rosea TaxID=64517 RepID=A0AAD5X148_9FUNG|nr:hypothetical protein HK097_009396 [Rhizophlyctis rosea]